MQRKLIVVDSRNRVDLFQGSGLIVKPNEVKVLRVFKNFSLLQESQHEIITAGFNCRIE